MAAAEYCTQDLGDRTSHLTNMAVQKTHPDYANLSKSLVSALNSLSLIVCPIHTLTPALCALQPFLPPLPPAAQLFDLPTLARRVEEGGHVPSGEEWLHQQLLPRMVEICRTVFDAAKDGFVRKRGFFDLLGVDFFLDESLHLWLLEVNTNPSLATKHNPYLEEIVPSVVDQAVDLVLQIHYPPHTVPRSGGAPRGEGEESPSPPPRGVTNTRAVTFGGNHHQPLHTFQLIHSSK